MTSEFSTQRTQPKNRKRNECGEIITDHGAISQKSNTIEMSNKKETPLPRHLDDIAGGQNNRGVIEQDSV